MTDRGSSPNPLFVGVDTGLTTTRAAILNAQGAQIATASAPSPRTQPSLERDPREHWNVTAAVIARAVAESGEAPERIAGVGLSGHGDGLYFIGDDLTPLAPAVLSQDTRAASILARWHEDGRFERALELGGTVPFGSGAPAPLIAWFKDRDPHLLANSRWLLTAKDWLRACLTGEVATDPTDAFSSFTDLATRSYSPALAEHFAAGDVLDRLPPIAESTAVTGMVTAAAAERTGLAAGTPVIAGSHDVAACLLATAGNRLGHTVMIAGTFGINIVLTNQPVRSRLLTCRPAPVAGRWTVRRTSPAAGANVDWAVSRFALDTGTAADLPSLIGESIDAALAVDAPPDAPTYLPYLFGGPPGRPQTAALLGLRPWHTPTDLLRAVLHSLTFNHRADVDELRRAVAVDTLYLTGGATASPRWVQLFADVLGTPIIVPATRETGALGAALCAAVGTGHFPDLDAAFAAMSGDRRVVEPRPGAHEAIEGAYQTYLSHLRAASTFTD